MTDPTMVEGSHVLWVSLARDGNVDAFEHLVREHQRSLYAFCRRLTGNHDEADEIAQETFVRAFPSIGQFRGDSRFGTWLHQIALNLVRSRARRRLRPVDIDPDSLPSGSAGGAGQGTTDCHGSDPFRRRRLEAAVRNLPERQRLTLMLKVCEERTHAEVAHLLGCTVGTTKANLFHALRRLRRALGGRA